MDESVDQLMARTTDDTGAQRAANMRRSQAKERGTLQADIQKNQTDVAKFNEERAPLAAEFRKIEAEVGPIKYVAALLYGESADVNVLEKAVRFVIIMIVIVFDPLALCLILAANKQFEWARQGKGGWIHDKDGTIIGVTPGTKLNDTEQVLSHTNNVKPVTQQEHVKEQVSENITIAQLPVVEVQPIELPLVTVVEVQPIELPLVTVVEVQPIELPLVTVVEPISAEVPVIEIVSDEPNPRTIEAAPGRNRGVMYSQPVQADNLPALGKASNSDFGNQFPETTEKGDVYLRTDFLPNRLFKFNGNKWIEVSKDTTDVYAYDELYIKYLIEQIDQNRYDPDMLTAIEREQIARYLEKNA